MTSPSSAWRPEAARSRAGRRRGRCCRRDRRRRRGADRGSTTSTCASVAARACRVRLFHRVAFAYDGAPGRRRGRWCSTARPARTWQRASGRRGAARALLQQHAAGDRHDRPAWADRPHQCAPSPGCSGPRPAATEASEPRSILAVVGEREREPLTAAVAAAAAGRQRYRAARAVGLSGRATARPGSSSRRRDGAPRTARPRPSTCSRPPSSGRWRRSSPRRRRCRPSASSPAAWRMISTTCCRAFIGYADLLLVNHRPTDPSFQDIMQIKQNANRARRASCGSCWRSRAADPAAAGDAFRRGAVRVSACC